MAEGLSSIAALSCFCEELSYRSDDEPRLLIAVEYWTTINENVIYERGVIIFAELEFRQE